MLQMSFLNYNRLTKIAGFGAVGVIAMGLYSCYRVANIHNDSSYFREALATAQAHAGVKKWIGTPISVGYVRVEPSEPQSSIAAFKTDIKGPIAAGIMFFWAERKMSGESVVINVTRIEVEISGDKTKRLLVKG